MFVSKTALVLAAGLNAFLNVGPVVGAVELPWSSPNRYRLIVRVDCGGIARSNCPASLHVDFAKQLSVQGIPGTCDEHTIEVVGYDQFGTATTFETSAQGYERYLLPWRLSKRYAANTATLSFVVPDETVETYAVYFDTVESHLGSPRRYPGLVGDGDFFRQDYGQRPIAACHFDCFADLDGDGDLDLFRGGVEPFVYCYENVGGNRFVDRGTLTSGGHVLTLPRNKHSNRSWIVPHFFDWDGDGDRDFFPSFMDGPYAGKIVFFENVTTEHGPLTFADRGPLVTSRGTAIAGGKQAGGWFPSVAFVPDFLRDGDGYTDLIVGNNNHIYFYRNRGSEASKTWRLDEAVALEAAGREIELLNPCLDVADVDCDGDWDLFVSPQSGPIHWFENTGAKGDGRIPGFAKGIVVAYDERNLQQSGHPRVTVADFTGDGLLDLAVDRAWELADLDHLSDDRDYGALFKNVGDASHPKWERATRFSETPHTEDFPICDALRQNIVRAVDWNDDGKTDLLAGDCDGFVWYFQNRTNNVRPVFAAGRRLEAGGQVLSRASHQGHARHDVCDWNDDGRKDLIVSDGAGLVTAYLNEGSNAQPVLGPGQTVKTVDDQGDPVPIDRGTRSHLLVCDWDNDGKKDLIFSDQQNPGFYCLQNVGTDAEPLFAPAKNIGLTPYVRPNLGSFVDWDGDGRRDLIACEFEHSIRFYRNVGTGAPGDPPVFDNPDGKILLKPYCIMMISGADVIDWNGDGDLDILTGQGHGGSGLRFYERDYIEDCLNGTHPKVTVARFETAPTDHLAVVRRYADAMLEHGRDVYGRQKTGLLLSALDRHKLRPLDVRPEPPGGIRREDRAGLPWKPLTGANPQLDQNLLRVFDTLTDLTGDSRYRDAADHEIQWFFQNAQSPVTGLLPWGEHMSWGVLRDTPIAGGTELIHEFARPWMLWDRTFQLAPDAARRFALGLWNHQIANHKTGAFDRHAPYSRHGPRDGRDFVRHAGFYVHTWAYAYQHTQDKVFLEAIDAVLTRFERKRSAASPAVGASMALLDFETAARLTPEPLASRLRRFAQQEEQRALLDLHRQYGQSDGSLVIQPTWQAKYGSGIAAGWAMFAWARYQQAPKPELQDVIVAVADAYLDTLPEEDADVWPMSFGQIISTQVAAWRLTGRNVYLEQACRFARMAIDIFFQDNPLPRASFKTDHYETVTGADSLALALLEVHIATHGLQTTVPSNTIDR